MKTRILYGLLTLLLATGSKVSFASDKALEARFNFCGDNISFSYDSSVYVDFNASLSPDAVGAFYEEMEAAGYEPVITALLAYKHQHRPDDWLYYQLIRRTAQKLSPKVENYNRYTLYKWYLMCKSGYDATLSVSASKILFYVQSDESVYEIPTHTGHGKQYICLNYHDYGQIDFEQEKFTPVVLPVPGATHAFSYKITRLPDFSPEDYKEKDLGFNYHSSEYKFTVKVNPQVKNLFANYPVTDYQAYLNMPLSSGTYSTLIPALKEYTRAMSQRQGVDYLMRFTRYAFLYETDRKNFGKEKRLSPEQTLLYDYSDCEDRSALFFYLVKEIYNLPMIVLVFPQHVTIAVKFDKPVGTPIMYNGSRYSVCEPTPQKRDLSVGELAPELDQSAYEVGYAYNP